MNLLSATVVIGALRMLCSIGIPWESLLHSLEETAWKLPFLVEVLSESACNLKSCKFILG